MGLFTKIRRHAAVSGGDFGAMFKDVTLPTLPVVATRLLAEFDAGEPDVGRLTKIISSDVDVTARVMRTVNSSFYNLSVPVKSLQQAIAMMGLQNLYSLALSYAVKGAIPEPESGLFDQQAFWTDSLLRALLARELSNCMLNGDQDEAFTVMLLSDVAIPVLLSSWRNYYEPVMERWACQPGRLSAFERDEFDWDHAMAGAWILESWAFPEEVVTLVGAHNSPVEKIHELGLDATIALPLALASQMPSVLRRGEEGISDFIESVVVEGGISPQRLATVLDVVADGYAEIHTEFDLAGDGEPRTIFLLREEIADMIAEASS